MALNFCRNTWYWQRSLSAKDHIDRFGEELEIIPIRTDRFSPELLQGIRLIIPTVAAGEGGAYYCILDQAILGNEMRVSCRGFVFAYSMIEAIEKSSLFNQWNEYGDVRCYASGALDPQAGYIQSILKEHSFFFVPAATHLSEISSVLDSYRDLELPLSPL